MKVVLITGGFDPLHAGHLAYIKEAKALGNILVVGVNSDAWLERKKGAFYQSQDERFSILSELKDVDAVLRFNDDDGSASDAIIRTRELFPDDIIIFANGGDRTAKNIPEQNVVDNKLEFVFGVGGDNKKNSSSWILKKMENERVLRQWGYYRVLHDVAKMKVKELVVAPGKSLSMQRHKHRNELWMVQTGECVVKDKMLGPIPLKQHDEYRIRAGNWHQLTNPYDEPCKVIEIQYGDSCVEDDIQREVT
jgi:cytidyltransferase-like protein